MGNRKWILWNVLLGLMLFAGVASAAPAAKQSQQTTPVVATAVAAGCKADQNQALVVCVESTSDTPNGSFARAAAYAQRLDGSWVRLTPCDNLAVACDPLTFRMEDAARGDEFVLQSYEAP